MTIENIRKQIQEADKLRSDLASNYRLQFREPLRNKITEIRANLDYTPSGKDKLIEAARKRESRKLLQFAQKQSQKYAELLQKARKEAEAVVHANTPAVDAELEQRFSKRLREVKTEIMLSDAKKGKQLLTDFLTETGDTPAFATKVKDEYAELIQPVKIYRSTGRIYFTCSRTLKRNRAFQKPEKRKTFSKWPMQCYRRSSSIRRWKTL